MRNNKCDGAPRAMTNKECDGAPRAMMNKECDGAPCAMTNKKCDGAPRAMRNKKCNRRATCPMTDDILNNPPVGEFITIYNCDGKFTF